MTQPIPPPNPVPLQDRLAGFAEEVRREMDDREIQAWLGKLFLSILESLMSLLDSFRAGLIPAPDWQGDGAGPARPRAPEMQARRAATEPEPADPRSTPAPRTRAPRAPLTRPAPVPTRMCRRVLNRGAHKRSVMRHLRPPMRRLPGRILSPQNFSAPFTLCLRTS
jgi:hypothetical protein